MCPGIGMYGVVRAYTWEVVISNPLGSDGNISGLQVLRIVSAEWTIAYGFLYKLLSQFVDKWV